MAKNVRDGPPVEGRTRQRWDYETLACGVRGHRVPAADARTWSHDTPVAQACGDRRFGRCLRCDAWVAVDPAWASADELAPPDQLAMPRRGKELRDALVLRIIAVDRALHAVVFAALAVVVFLVKAHLGVVQRRAGALMTSWQQAVAGTGPGASHSFVVRELDKVTHLHPGGLAVIFATACAYAAVEGVEAVGLWFERRWAEYLTAVATAGFLPFEIHELLNRVTVGRVVALVINVAVLVYLVWAKRLFGIRARR